MNCLFLSGDFKFQVSPKVLIPCPRSTPRGSRPRWLSWMRRPTGDQEVAGSNPPPRGRQHLVEIDYEIMKYFLRSFSAFR